MLNASDAVLNNSNVIESNGIGGVVSKLTDRVDSIEIKMTSLTNVVKLMQKYTESKDEQYEKEKENFEFKTEMQAFSSNG